MRRDEDGGQCKNIEMPGIIGVLELELDFFILNLDLIKYINWFEIHIKE